MIYFDNPLKIGIRFLDYYKLYIKISCINNLKVLFLSHRLLNFLLEKKNRNGGHQANFLSGEQNLSLPPHILRIIQNKTLWSVLFVIYINSYYL